MTAGLEILNLHAQGGMAEVYRARATDERGRTWHYAVKRILPELIQDPEMLRMFIEEQRVAACLVHDNIVRVYDVAHADGSAAGTEHFIVMEFLEGKDLGEAIEAAQRRGRPLPVWFALHLARDVCKALHHATMEARDKSGRVLGLIHRDVSPHNIFVCRDGQVKLTDFGVARVETAEVKTRAGVIKGKFGYMSPEQLSGQPLDCRSDLYNVGILLYEMLAGRRLFWGETATQFVAAMMMNEVPPLDPALLVPPELDAVMRRALARKRDDRPATPLAFEAELAAIAERYGLVATRAHLAGELQALFPELATAEGAPVPAESAPRAEGTGAKKLTMLSEAPAGLADAAPIAESSEGGDAVFTLARPAHKPQQLSPSQERALAGPTSDDMIATLVEARPSAQELGLADDRPDPADPDDDAPRTEPQRAPAFGGRASSTAPGGPVRAPEDDPATLEVDVPRDWAKPPVVAARHRISTGTSRRVVSLEGDDETSGPLPRKR